MKVRHTLWLVVSLTAGCFRDPSSQIAASERAAPQTLEVKDPGGASFAPDGAPRDPQLQLWLDDGAPVDAAHALLLLRGVFDPTFMTRFVSARQGSALKDRTIELSVSQERHGGVSAHPSQSLLPGARYSLTWLTADVALSFALSVSRAPSLGARLVESWPSSDDDRVPPALARLLLRFDGSIVGDLTSLVTLQTADGALVPTLSTREPCAARGLPEGDCVWLAPQAELHAGASYRLLLDSGLSTQTDAPIPASELRFDVADEADVEPPQLLGASCALDELASQGLCLRVDDAALFVSGSVSESALVTLTGLTNEPGASASTLSVANTFSLRLPLSGAADAASLRVTDLAGRTLDSTLAFARADDLARVSIDELRADPLGKEPAQEYVELVNFGVTPVSLMGFSLSTDVHARGRALTATSASALMLASGERVLVVASDFDPRDPSDGVLPSGVRLIALDGALSLANSGATVVLRDAAGRRVSSGTALPGLVEGQCSARFHSDSADSAGNADSAHANDATSDLRSGAASDFELDPLGGCTPGRATFPRP